MEDVIEKKNQIQKSAEDAHEKFNCQSTVCMSVGLGKGKLAINRIEKQFIKNPNAKILFSGAREIYLQSFKKELKKFNHEDWIDDIIFCCSASLKKFEKIQFDLVIIDEIHKSTDQAVEFLLKQKTLNFHIEILCLTGTPKKSRNQLFETSLESVAPISYSKKIDAAIEQGLLNDYKMFIVYHELEDKTPIYLHKYKETTYYKTERQQHDYLLRKYQQCSNKNGFPFELVNLKLFFKNLSSKEKLAKLFLSTSLKDKKTLIYAGSIKQTKNFDIPPYHSELPKKERENNFNDFCDSKFLHLIDVNGIKESVNIQNLTHVLMMAPDASQNLFLQSLGKHTCPIKSSLIQGNLNE